MMMQMPFRDANANFNVLMQIFSLRCKYKFQSYDENALDDANALNDANANSNIILQMLLMIQMQIQMLVLQMLLKM